MLRPPISASHLHLRTITHLTASLTYLCHQRPAADNGGNVGCRPLWPSRIAR
jgi:hypothetical protein